MEDESIVPYRCTTIVYYTWKIFTCLFTHVMLVTTVVAYCLLGAKTFESLEKENEIAVKNNISVMRGKVADYIWDVTQNMPVLHEQNWSEIVFRRLKVFEDDLIVAIRKEGWDGIEDTGTLQWTFTGALFYSIIVITTIGYGHIAPKTVLGKVTTIFYAILGIPLMLLCLSNIGDIMAHSFRFLYWRICCYACTRPPKRTQRRSRRGTVRSHGGRSSWRSRTASASFRRSGRTSQRSADSALGSQSLVHSYSDTDCRYFRETEREVTSLGRRGINRQSTHQAGNALNMEPVQMTPMNNKNSVDRQGKGKGQSEVGQTDLPVLFNKYALDREESQRVHQKSLGRGGRLLQRGHSAAPDLESGKNGVFGDKHHLAVGHPSEPHSSTIPRRARSQGRQLQEPAPYQQSPSPRIMSPMGFAVQRQTYLRQREMDYEYSDYDDSPPTKPVPIWLCVFLVVSYIIGGTFLFSGWEKWNYADSAYFCFITLTTIGFGDFVPAQRDKKDPEISIALCSLYLLFGISLLAMSFNLVQEEVISNVKAVARHLGILKDKNEEEDDDDDEDLD